MHPGDTRKKYLRWSANYFTQHAKGLATGVEKKSTPAVGQMLSNMIKWTGLPAWSVFIAVVDFFNNKKIYAVIFL